MTVNWWFLALGVMCATSFWAIVPEGSLWQNLLAFSLASMCNAFVREGFHL